jgi:hypothetical protein
MSEKIRPHHLERKAIPVRTAVLRPSGSPQSRERRLTICDARSSDGAGHMAERQGFSVPLRDPRKTALKSTFSGQPWQVVCTGSMYRTSRSAQANSSEW